MNISSRLALLTIFTCAAFGWDPSQRDCDNHPLCLTSFKWCDVNGEGCYFPDGAYPTTANPTHDESLYALLLENKKFTVSWKTRPQKKDVPVRVQWVIDGGATWEKSRRYKISPMLNQTANHHGRHDRFSNCIPP